MSNNGLSMEDISRGVRSFTVGTAVSRVMGLVREIVFAHLFGVGAATDAFNVAFRIPNLLRDLFAETALSAAFVPVLTAEKAKGKEAENRLASNIFNVLFVVTGLVSLAGLLRGARIWPRPSPSASARCPGKIDLTAQLTAVLFPFLLFISLGAWAMSYLNTEKSFFVPSVAPAVFNLFSILFPLLTYGWYVARGKEPIFGMAVGVLIGGLMQFLVQVPLAPAQGLPLEARPELPRPGVPPGHGPVHPRRHRAGRDADQRPRQHDPRHAAGPGQRQLAELRLPHHAPAPRALRHRRRDRGPAVALEARPRERRRGRQVDARGLAEDGPVPDRADLGPHRLPVAVPVTRVIYQRGHFTAEDTLATAVALVLYTLGIPFIAGPPERRRGLLRLQGRQDADGRQLRLRSP